MNSRSISEEKIKSKLASQADELYRGDDSWSDLGSQTEAVFLSEDNYKVDNVIYQDKNEVSLNDNNVEVDDIVNFFVGKD